MKKIIVFFILWGTVQLAFTQSNELNILQKQLLLAKNDTSKVLILAKLVDFYARLKPDSAFKYASAGLKLAQQNNYLKGEALLLLRLGALYRETGDLPKALDLALKVLPISQQNGFLGIEANTFLLFGNIYHDLGNYKKSNYYAQQAISINKRLKDIVSLNGDFLNISSNYIELGNTDSASYYAQKAYNGYVKLHTIDQDTYMWRDMGRIEFKLGNYNQALAYLKKALLITKNSQDHRNASYNCAQLAEVFEKTNKIDSVIFYGKLGVEEGEKGPFNFFILRSSIQLVNAFKHKNDFKSALFYSELVQKTKEGLFGAGNIEAINKLIAEENERKKEVDDQKIAYKNQVKQYLLIVGAAVILLIAFIIYRNYKKQRKANNLLYQQKDEINTALLQLKATQAQLIQSEKMASLGELTAGIAHEIQNPLNFVNNFSEVSKELLAELKEELDKSDIEEAKLISTDVILNLEKINHHGKRADAIVKGMLEHSRVNTGQREPTNINDLADEYLRLAYHGLRAKDKNFNAEIITNFDENLPKVNVIPQDIGRVLLNLFNNAFYAVNQKQKKAEEGYKPEVIITTKTENNQFIIKIKDNGSGIPNAIKDKIMQPFFTTKPTGEGTGLGLSLSYDIVVKGHGGTIEVNTEESEFTEFMVSLPISLS
ncbi:MAG: tetratricopeptide repeat-containing sensor histidine kinase [Mucilaginibacter sp.]